MLSKHIRNQQLVIKTMNIHNKMFRKLYASQMYRAKAEIKWLKWSKDKIKRFVHLPSVYSVKVFLLITVMVCASISCFSKLA